MSVREIRKVLCLYVGESVCMYKRVRVGERAKECMYLCKSVFVGGQNVYRMSVSVIEEYSLYSIHEREKKYVRERKRVCLCANTRESVYAYKSESVCTYASVVCVYMCKS